MIQEALVGLSVLTLCAVLAAGLSRAHAAATERQRTRLAALRVAELELTRLQTGDAALRVSDDWSLVYEPGAPLEGRPDWVWLTVAAAPAGRTATHAPAATLRGPVPEASLVAASEVPAP